MLWSETCVLATTLGFQSEFGQKTSNPSAKLAQETGNDTEPLMTAVNFPGLQTELRSKVLARTGSQLQDLGIELLLEGIPFFGQTTTFYVKHVAQHCVRELLPDVRLVNDILVR
jgi:hypothetical protein